MKRQGEERHHIIPKHRLKNPTALIKAPDHQTYHTIFGVNTPEEVLDWLVKKVWGGKLSIVREYLKRKEVDYVREN